MDELKVESEFMKRVGSMILSHQVSKKLDKPIGIGLYRLEAVEVEGQTYDIRIDCDIRISKEDLKRLIWNE